MLQIMCIIGAILGQSQQTEWGIIKGFPKPAPQQKGLLVSSDSRPADDTSSRPKKIKRWYDQDPALSQALQSLKRASDKYQAQIALNIILIIVEHQIESETLSTVDDLLETLEHSKKPNKTHHRRWYDINGTLRSAMQLLEDCPEDVQQKILPSISAMVEATLKDPLAHGL